MQLEILIPTYNRSEFLIRNLRLIESRVRKEGLLEKIHVLISDNCSTDQTQQEVEKYINEKNEAFQVSYYRTEENIGLEANTVHVLAKATAEWIMFVGDDDYIPEGYLTYCLKNFQQDPELGVIIPGLFAVSKDGTKIDQRAFDFDEKRLPAGYETLLTYSHYAHQMSGLAMKRNGLYEEYCGLGELRNIYLFIYFAANRITQFKMIFAPKYKVDVMVFNAKDWSYNNMGLLDEVFKNYYPFVKLYGEEKVSRLLIYFTMMHSYRLSLSRLRLLRVFRTWKKLLSSVRRLKGLHSGLSKLILKEYVRLWIKR